MQVTSSANKREIIDSLKGFAIVFVVYSHCMQLTFKDGFVDYQFNNITFKIISSFIMPLFMSISGYLYYKSIIKKTYKEMIIITVKRMLIPIVSWGIIEFLYRMVHDMVLLNTYDLRMIDLAYNIICGPWYLCALFIFYVIGIVLHYIFHDKLFFVLFLFGLSFVISDSYHLYLYKFVFPFFFTGYYMNKFKITNKFPLNPSMLLILAIIYMALIYFASRSVFETSYSFIGNNYLSITYNVLYRLILGLLSCLIIVNIRININTIKCDLLSKIGKHSMEIYLLSIYTNRLLQHTYKSNNYFYCIIWSIITIIVCFFIGTVLKKNNTLNTVLFGGRKI